MINSDNNIDPNESFEQFLESQRKFFQLPLEEIRKHRQKVFQKDIDAIKSAFEKNDIHIYEMKFEGGSAYGDYECFIKTPTKRIRLTSSRYEVAIETKFLFFYWLLIQDIDLMTPEWKAAHPGSQENPYIRPSLYEMIRAVRFKLGATE